MIKLGRKPKIGDFVFDTQLPLAAILLTSAAIVIMGIFLTLAIDNSAKDSYTCKDGVEYVELIKKDRSYSVLKPTGNTCIEHLAQDVE